MKFTKCCLSRSSGFCVTGVVEDWASKALSWLQGLAADEEVWNTTMGTTRDFFVIPAYEESGLLCAYSYFHSIYVIEWYYDYVGYDYYHEDFNFYYYDDTYYNFSVSGSGSGDYYYEDYSGWGSGSGKMLIRLENFLYLY